jgi:hypothetical protein
MFVKDTAANMERFELKTVEEVADVAAVKNASGVETAPFKLGVRAVTESMLNRGLVTRMKRFSDNNGVIQVKGPIHVDFFKGKISHK